MDGDAEEEAEDTSEQQVEETSMSPCLRVKLNEVPSTNKVKVIPSTNKVTHGASTNKVKVIPSTNKVSRARR